MTTTTLTLLELLANNERTTFLAKARSEKMGVIDGTYVRRVPIAAVSRRASHVGHRLSERTKRQWVERVRAVNLRWACERGRGCVRGEARCVPVGARGSFEDHGEGDADVLAGRKGNEGEHVCPFENRESSFEDRRPRLPRWGRFDLLRESPRSLVLSASLEIGSQLRADSRVSSSLLSLTLAYSRFELAQRVCPHNRGRCD